MDDHVSENRRHWNEVAADWVTGGEQAWGAEVPEWGIWRLPESEVSLLPADMTGMDAVELGCGTGYVSAWMAARGARVTGVDVSEGQLATARRLAQVHGADITFVHANAEQLDFADASFDFAVSEYGAAIWCDPYVWIPEAWRILRPGGHLVFLGHHPMTILTYDERGSDCDFTLHRPYKGMHRSDWTEVEIDPGGIDFNLTFSAWLALFRDIGFDVLDYRELFAPDTATGDRFTIPVEWAKRYPSEQVWFLAKPGDGR